MATPSIDTPPAAPASVARDTSDDLVPCNEVDYLDQDPVIRGQKYACVSFISPKDAIASKEAFCIREFLSKVSRDVHEMLETIETIFGSSNPQIKETVRLVLERHEHLWDEDTMQNEFRMFKEQEADMLDDNFKKAHGNFKSSVHGFKIRGSYDTVEEAQKRAGALKRLDNRFNVFVAEVGCWCPWDPSTSSIEDVEYSETQLNTLMKKYNDQQESRDELYNRRKTHLIDQMENQKETWLENIKRAAEKQATGEDTQEEEPKAFTVTLEKLEEESTAAPAEQAAESTAAPIET